jgi:hypothetical protein
MKAHILSMQIQQTGEYATTNYNQTDMKQSLIFYIKNC